MIIKDPKLAHGMLVLTSENVIVLGGRVEALAARTEAIKVSLQRSTLPKEWSDSLGQIDDLPTDTRLEGDATDSNQPLATSSSPVRPPLPPSAPSIPLSGSNMGHSTTLTTVFRTQVNPTSPTATSPSTPYHPSRPFQSPLAPSNMSPSSTPIQNTLITQTISSRSSLILPSSSGNDSASLLPSAFNLSAVSDGDMDVDTIAAQYVSKGANTAASAPPDEESPSSSLNSLSRPKSGAIDVLVIEEDVPEVIESVDAYIDRIESSQPEGEATVETQEDEPDDDPWMEQDMEDYFMPSEHHDIPESQELIEPLVAPSTSSHDLGDENDDSETVRVGYHPNKRRKLSEVGEDDEQNGQDGEILRPISALHATDFGANMQDPKEEELVYMTETEYDFQMERNAQMALISELQFMTNKRRKYKIHATCIDALRLELDNGVVNWTILITDPSNEELYVRVSPIVAAQVLGFDSSSELTQSVKSNNQRFQPLGLLEKAKASFTSEVVVEWDNSAHTWLLTGF